MEADAKIIEYRDETTLRFRLFAVFVLIPFILFIAISFLLILGSFESNAADLIGLVLQGDFTRLDDLAGYLFMLFMGVGIPGTMLFILMRKGVFVQNTIVRFDPNRRVVSIHRERPWQAARLSEYAFSEVEAIKLADRALTVSEMNEISLRIGSLQRPLILAEIFDTETAKHEVQKLKNLGLPSH